MILLYLLFAFVLLLVIKFLFYLGDDLHIATYHKPMFIHFYPTKKKLYPSQELLLLKKFEFYGNLSPKKQRYFNHRLAHFLERYEFIGRDDFEITEEVEILIGATYIMLTFGMRKYLLNVFDKIILYPEAYYSSHSEQYHKGEFNPGLKVVVFSWEHFLEGYSISNDNLNLGIHEFTHVIHHHSLRSEDASAMAFVKQYKKILAQFHQADIRQRLIDSSYFRIYAFTNPFEFISVIIEHYFETPQKFKEEFPELYKNVSRMLNHQH